MDPQLLKLLKKRQAAAAESEAPSSPRASNSGTNNSNYNTPLHTPQSTPLTNKWKTLELQNNDITKPSITATPVKTPQSSYTSTYTRGVAQAPTSAYGTNTVYSATTPKVGNHVGGSVGGNNVPTTPTDNNKLVYDKNNSNWDDSDDDNVVLLGMFNGMRYCNKYYGLVYTIRSLYNVAFTHLQTNL